MSGHIINSVTSAILFLQGPPGLVSPSEAYYVRLVEHECRIMIDGIDLNGHLFANVHFLGGIHTTLEDTFNKSSFFRLDSLGDYSIALQRLSKVPKAIDGSIETLKQGIEKGVTYAEESMSRVDEQFERVLREDPTESGFYTPFRDMSKKGFNDIIVNAIQGKAKSVISSQIIPALAKLRAFLKDEYSQHLRSGPGVSYITNGKEFYQKALEYHTTIKDLTPKEIHDIGLEEIKELREGVLEVAEKLGYGNLTFKEFVTLMQEDPKQKFSSGEELLAYAREIVQDRINPKMPTLVPEEFLTERLYSLEVKKTAPGSGGIAYYYQGNEDNTRNGTYYINTRNLEAFKRFELIPLSLHEGNPGHHFDLTVVRFARDFPGFLHSGGFGHYASFPAGTPIYTSFQVYYHV